MSMNSVKYLHIHYIVPSLYVQLHFSPQCKNEISVKTASFPE